MKSSVLVPVILIVCLVALALLISQAFSATQPGQVSPQDSTNSGSAPKSLAVDSADIYDAQAAIVADTGGGPAELEQVAEAGDGNLPTDNQGVEQEGEYLVIAGSFRQVSNAQSRVAALREAGFSATEMSKFDRGTYAVALVSRSDDYTEAITTAGRVRAAGFEAKVYRKR